MRTIVLLIVLAMSFAAQAQEEQELAVMESQNSGCLNHTRASADQPVQTIRLMKEGEILTIDLLNYYSNCGTKDFLVKANVSQGEDDVHSSVYVNVDEVVPAMTNCTCPFNLTFTVRGLKANSFYLNCWWCDGLIELTEGEPLLLEYKTEEATVEGLKYTLLSSTKHAMLNPGNKGEGELSIPSELSYEGQKYIITSIAENAFGSNNSLTKVIIPRTIKNMNFNSNDGFNNFPFHGCTSLKSVEVEEGNPAICAVDGVLFDKKKTKLLGYPAGAERETYTIPTGVTCVEASAFYNTQYLKRVTFPDEVKTLGFCMFLNSKKLEEVKLPSGMEVMESYLFKDCERLQRVEIPHGVTTIEMGVFENCVSLKTLDLPKSVRQIGMSAFSGCKLETLCIRGIVDFGVLPSLIFSNMGTKTELYVQPSEVERYKAVYKGPVYPLPDNMSGISNIIRPNSNSSELFDLQGRRVSGQPTRGLYIQNGKKYLIK